MHKMNKWEEVSDRSALGSFVCLPAYLLVFVVADFNDLPWKLELELVMSHLTLVMLGTRLGSFGKAASALTESDCD